MTRFALLALLAACTPDGTTTSVHVSAARAQYTEQRTDGKAWDRGLSPGPEVIAHFTVDGETRATCKKRWTALEVVCDLDLDVAPTAQLALVLEDDDDGSAERMGAGTLALAALGRAQATLPLVADGAVLRGSVTVAPRWQPRVPLAAAQAILVVGGALLALLLYAALRHRFVVGKHRAAVPATGVRSAAMISAGLATLAAWVAMVPLLDHAHTLEPLALAAPMGAGAYAVTATIIDAVASHSFGRRRGQILFGAIAATVALPLVMTVAAVPPKLLVVGIVIVAIGLFV